ncbi:ECF transporter S component [Corynebacterium sp. UBA2622]|uniref:ECF transporter S component n=1 Tax=Corynebacterium sp. UBA2622 TaxID=1946393 RepID=UPI0025BA3543|nr:ECF transporter S component [Corynebacterium sp. UBA2622]
MTAPTSTTPARSLQWRVIDIVTAAVLGVACGLIFWVWNTVGYAGFKAFDALTPGLGGLFTGVWFLGGTLGGLIIRKPGAAVFVEVIAASVSALIGSQWGIETLYSGLAQGLGAELVFLIFAYRRFSLTVAALAGVGSAVGAFILELFTSGNLAMSITFNVIYLVCMAISGVVLAGLLAYWLVGALAKTGALDRFAAGRERFGARGI